jgi:hypothetical protein
VERVHAGPVILRHDVNEPPAHRHLLYKRLKSSKLYDFTSYFFLLGKINFLFVLHTRKGPKSLFEARPALPPAPSISSLGPAQFHLPSLPLISMGRSPSLRSSLTKDGNGDPRPDTRWVFTPLEYQYGVKLVPMGT